VILSGKLHRASWYQQFLPDRVVVVLDIDWMTDEIGIECVKHFVGMETYQSMKEEIKQKVVKYTSTLSKRVTEGDMSTAFIAY
jgi:hypothetical protein